MTKRRSWLLVPVSKPDLIERAAKSGADVVVLDLAEFVVEADRECARKSFAAALQSALAGGAEVFSQVDPTALYDDLTASVHPGLTGIVMTRAESAAQVAEADTLMSRLESERGIAPGTLQIVAALETARGNHAAYDIARASPRICALTLGRADLIMDLHPEPSQEIHLMPYLMQRLIIVAGAIGITPLGAWWRAPDRGLYATADNTYAAGHRGRAIGFKGALCLVEPQIEALNRAYG
ncbi:MAG TPA: aldolase/citrate lyase family protein [Burkholderiales bacterium]|nr:aldolase/citrate lyase family protein [Burkholderiales bacterium]